MKDKKRSDRRAYNQPINIHAHALHIALSGLPIHERNA